MTGKLRDRSRLIVTHKKELAVLADRVYYIDGEGTVREVDRYFIDSYFDNTSTYTVDNTPKLQQTTAQQPNKAVAKETVDESLKAIIMSANGLTV